MKRIYLFFFLSVSVGLLACGNEEKKGKSPQAITADSLFKDVMEGHDVGMAKMGRLTRTEQATRRLIDSIQQLPAKAKQAAEPLRVKLDSLQKDLKDAELAMEKWMNEFNLDSSLNDLEQRIDYLESEKIKVSKVKDAILGSLQQADSVLQKKF